MAHTPGPWDFTIFSKEDGGEIVTPQDVADTVAHSALRCEGTQLWGVSDSKLSDDGAVLVICYTGNGPTSAENASFIARACNLHSDLTAALKWALGTVNCEPFEWSCQEDSEAHHAALAAIAKAEAAA